MRLGVGFQVTLQRRQLPVVVLDEGQIHRNGAAHLWLGEVLEQPRALRGPRGPNTQRGQVVLVVGVGDVCEQLRARSHEVISTAHEISGCAHRLGIDIGLRQHPAAQQPRDLVRVDPVVLGFAAVDRTHVERVPQHEHDALARAQVRQPVPREHALGCHRQVLAVGRQRFADDLVGDVGTVEVSGINVIHTACNGFAQHG